MLQLLKRLSDNRQSGTLADHLRRKRFALFTEMLAGMSRPVRVLDVGGTVSFWERMGFRGMDRVEVTLLNLHTEQTDVPGISTMAGNACDLSHFDDNSFDIAFSNSVIEHVGGWEDQQLMAREMQRVGKHIFLQTPNKYFPLEPHFLFPFYQFLPLRVRVWLLMRFNLGWYPCFSSRDAAREAATSIRLMTRKELQVLFPGARIYRERFGGVTKSFVVVGSSSPLRQHSSALP